MQCLTTPQIPVKARNRCRRKSKWPVLALLITLILLSGTSSAWAEKSVYEWANIRLDHARQEKVQQLRRFCDNTHALALRMKHDPVMTEFFDISRQYRRLARGAAASAELTHKMEGFRKALNDYYIENYLAFYDVLFVDCLGVVLHSIRNLPAYQTNLFVEPLGGTPLAEYLRSKPESEGFIDYHYFTISDEPAAFFVEPIKHDGQLVGWFALQLALNKINSLFAGSEKLGATGEMLLVNHLGYMMTESAFEGDSTILQKHLDNRNIQTKFRQKQGRRIVTDYRGFTTLTSFEVFDFLTVQWVVVAKIDEAQVITGHYRQHRKYYGGVIKKHVASYQQQGAAAKSVIPQQHRIVRVDMDEFVRAKHGEWLQTLGVSSCTGLIAAYPKKFGYLAHITPYDKVYGGTATNLVGHVVNKIKVYDIYKYERRCVLFTIIAKHLDSTLNIIDKLVDEGFLLSQISIAHYPNAHCANVSYDYTSNETLIEWRLSGAGSNRNMRMNGHLINIGNIVKQHISD